MFGRSKTDSLTQNLDVFTDENLRLKDTIRILEEEKCILKDRALREEKNANEASMKEELTDAPIIFLSFKKTFQPANNSFPSLIIYRRSDKL